MSKEIFNKEQERLENLNYILDAHYYCLERCTVVGSAVTQRTHHKLNFDMSLIEAFLYRFTPDSFIKMVRIETNNPKFGLNSINHYVGILYNERLSDEEERNQLSQFILFYLRQMDRNEFDGEKFVRDTYCNIAHLLIFIKHAIKNGLFKNDESLKLAGIAVHNFEELSSFLETWEDQLNKDKRVLESLKQAA